MESIPVSRRARRGVVVWGLIVVAGWVTVAGVVGWILRLGPVWWLLVVLAVGSLVGVRSVALPLAAYRDPLVVFDGPLVRFRQAERGRVAFVVRDRWSAVERDAISEVQCWGGDLMELILGPELSQIVLAGGSVSFDVCAAVAAELGVPVVSASSVALQIRGGFRHTFVVRSSRDVGEVEAHVEWWFGDELVEAPPFRLTRSGARGGSLDEVTFDLPRGARDARLVACAPGSTFQLSAVRQIWKGRRLRES